MALPGDHISDRDFRRLADLIGSRCGVVMSPVKRTMLETRLAKRVRALGLPSMRAYCEHILSAKGWNEWPNLVDVVTTHKTDFFREAAHFDYLLSSALPDLEENFGAGRRRPLFAWCAACSTGEEPYTLGMVLSRYADAAAPNPYDFRIEASDISGAVLETARLGVYSEETAAPIPQEFRRRYLLRSKDRGRNAVRIAPEIRARVQFTQRNLMDAQYEFENPFDVVLCRNVMIYFDRVDQQKVLNRISGSLRKGGYLLMGHSESLNGLDLPLVPVAPTVYRRRNG
jgi:chemotaxis protein methyltransferase CheR